MFLKGLQSFFVWKKCQVSSATAPSVPYKKVTLSNFIRMYTVCLWKASNRIFQNHYQKIPLCKIRCLRCSCTQVYCIHMPTEKEYLSFQYATSTHHFSSPHWTHSYVTKIHLFLANKQKRRKQCSYTRKQAHQPSDSGLPPNTFFLFFFLSEDNPSLPTLPVQVQLCCWTVFLTKVHHRAISFLLLCCREMPVMHLWTGLKTCPGLPMPFPRCSSVPVSKVSSVREFLTSLSNLFLCLIIATIRIAFHLFFFLFCNAKLITFCWVLHEPNQQVTPVLSWSRSMRDLLESIFFQAIFPPITWLLHLHSFCSTLNSLQLVSYLKAWYPKLNSVPTWKLTNVNLSRKNYISYCWLCSHFCIMIRQFCLATQMSYIEPGNFKKHNSFFQPSLHSQLLQRTWVTKYPWTHIAPCTRSLLKSIQCFSDHFVTIVQFVTFILRPHLVLCPCRLS